MESETGKNFQRVRRQERPRTYQKVTANIEKQGLQSGTTGFVSTSVGHVRSDGKLHAAVHAR